jgi:heat shock protein HslJ
MMKRRILGLGLALALAGCEARDSAPTTAAPQPESAPGASAGQAVAPEAGAAPAALAGDEWTIFEIAGEQVSGVTMAFAEGRVAGRSACNRYTGPTSFTGPDRLAVARTASTMMACPDPQMEIEQRFHSALEQVARWSVADGVLTLSGADGSAIMRGRRN